MKNNIGEALLILGIIYLHLVYGLHWLITAVLVVIPIITWSHNSQRKVKANIKRFPYLFEDEEGEE